jgi:protoheme IX farnesyltransferase
MQLEYSDKSIQFPLVVKGYMSLLKLRLSFLVVFSSVIGYLLGGGVFHLSTLLIFGLGGMMLSGSSSAINQILEAKYDALMSRTKNRPIPTGVISPFSAWIFAVVVGFFGLGLIYFSTNLLTVQLALFSLILYAFIYTPLKRKGPIAVFVGAIPGAMPPLLGWVGATNEISTAALIIFAIQFIWQFPHFWAIAWVCDEDYKRAGYHLLPHKGKKDFNTAINIMVYTLFLIPLGLLPAKFGITGINSAMIATTCGVLFLAQTFTLMKEGSNRAAKAIMFGSFLYLPIVQIAFVLDKI